MSKRISLTDFDATRARKFIDERSRVLCDGREELFGRDWVAVVFTVCCRAKGKCQHPQCNALGDDVHHVIARSKGRDDRIGNLQLLCRHHHIQVDRRKVRWSDGN